MPFITEELWHQLSEKDTDCIVAAYPKAEAYDQNLLDQIELAQGIITKVGAGRNKAAKKKTDLLDLYIQKSDNAALLLSDPAWKDTIIDMAVLGNFEMVDDEPVNTTSFIVGTDKFYLDAKQEVNVEEEKERLEKDLKYQEGFVKSINGKLSNDRFVNNAPDQVVANERQKLADGMERIKAIKESLAKLG